MIIKTMKKNYVIALILHFLSNHVIISYCTCFEDNTYIVYAGNERFPSTTEKSAKLCQGKMCFWSQIGLNFKEPSFQSDVRGKMNALFGFFISQ